MKQTLLALAIAATLAACVPTPEPAKPGAQTVSGSGGAGLVDEITLSDGTPCAVVIGYRKAAISCGWEIAVEQ